MRALVLVVLAGCWTGPEDSLPRQPVAPVAPAAPASDAKVIEKREHGGVIELVGDRAQAMTRAQAVMAAHCGDGAFTIVAEGNEAVASGATAWRVHYQCG